METIEIFFFLWYHKAFFQTTVAMETFLLCSLLGRQANLFLKLMNVSLWEAH